MCAGLGWQSTLPLSPVLWADCREEVESMKIVHPICCGVDVHKKAIVATIVRTGKDNVAIYDQRSFGTLNCELHELRDWLLENGCRHVCMESTGKYWIPLFNVLEEHMVEVVVTHPKYVRAIKGKKTDRRDSKWIADLYRHDMVRSSFIPPKDIRECRELSRYRFKLCCMRSSEKNRYQDCMTVSNIGLASVLADPFGKTCQEIMAHILTSDVPDEKHCVTLVRGIAKRKTGRILQAIHDCEVRPDQRFKMTEAKSHMDFLDNMIARTEIELYVRMRPYLRLTELLCSMPGIGELAAALILSEIGTDMGVFEDASHLASWAGLAPASNESAGKKKSVRISRAGRFLKPLLVQCAQAAVKSTKDPYFALKYQRIKKRRGHKKAIIATARMMMVSIYHMLSNGEFFGPCDHERVVSPKPRHTGLTESAAIEFLRQRGYDISTLTKAP
jgi:transposase